MIKLYVITVLSNMVLFVLIHFYIVLVLLFYWHKILVLYIINLIKYFNEILD